MHLLRKLRRFLSGRRRKALSRHDRGGHAECRCLYGGPDEFRHGRGGHAPPHHGRQDRRDRLEHRLSAFFTLPSANDAPYEAVPVRVAATPRCGLCDKNCPLSAPRCPRGAGPQAR